MKALKNLKAARYAVSAAGIILGVAAAMLIFGMYQGGRAILREEFWSSGVRVYDVALEDESLGAEDYLQREDARLLMENMPEVKKSIPVLKLDARLKSYKAASNMLTLAVNGNYLHYANLKMLKGSFIKEQDVKQANKVIIIDDISARDLYGTTDIIGQKLDFAVGGKTVEFIVAGVFKNFNRNIETVFDEEFPGLCFIPESVPEDASFDSTVQKLIVMVDKKLHKELVKVRLSYLLEKEHEAKGVYDIEEYDQLAEVSKFIDKYKVFAVILSLVGLITGGIGVMNAMLLSIQERRKEIGLYKFYGSGVRELQYDIIFKTLVVCESFAILGMVLGILLAGVIGSFINIDAGLTLVSIFVTVAAAALVGILSSLFPSLRIRQVEASDAIWGEQQSTVQ